MNFNKLAELRKKMKAMRGIQHAFIPREIDAVLNALPALLTLSEAALRIAEMKCEFREYRPVPATVSTPKGDLHGYNVEAKDCGKCPPCIARAAREAVK
jgi:hypothetical protein